MKIKISARDDDDGCSEIERVLIFIWVMLCGFNELVFSNIFIHLSLLAVALISIVVIFFLEIKIIKDE